MRTMCFPETKNTFTFVIAQSGCRLSPLSRYAYKLPFFQPMRIYEYDVALYEVMLIILTRHSISMTGAVRPSVRHTPVPCQNSEDIGTCGFHCRVAKGI